MTSLSLWCAIVVLISCTSCSLKPDTPRGHWHEIVNEDTIHCYYISDTLVSVDRFTYGFSTKVLNGDIFESISLPNSTFSMLDNVDVDGNHFTIGDTILWTRMTEDRKTFLNDLSMGYSVTVHPPEVLKNLQPLSEDLRHTRIIVGPLKNSPATENRFGIQMDEVLIDISDLVPTLIGEYSNSKKILVIHADKDAPDGLLEDIVREAQRSGYRKENLYRTVVDTTKLTLGLVRCE